MTIDERRQRIHRIANVINEALDELDRFVLIVFPNDPPPDGKIVQFDIISSCRDREYVATVLDNVIAGIDADLQQPVEEQKPN